MESKAITIKSKNSRKVTLRMIPGHFATNHSHINYYIDITGIKCVSEMAQAAAVTLAGKYVNTHHIDTIICMDGCEVLGAYIAQELSSGGIRAINDSNSINVVSPEYNTNGQMIFMNNLEPMITNKNVLLLIASATTGKTINKALQCIQYYGGKTVGISAIFSAQNEIDGIEIDTIFNQTDIPDYKTFATKDCPDCIAGKRIDAIVNSYGYSKF